MFGTSKKYILCLGTASLLFAGACTPTVSQRGNLLEDYQVADIQVGQSTRSDVLRALGSPTVRSTFNPNIWYYIGQETEKRGILDPEVTRERIFLLAFNEEGIVETFEEVDRERIDIPYARSKTPTYGSDLTVMQQLLGNLGRFNPQGEEQGR